MLRTGYGKDSPYDRIGVFVVVVMILMLVKMVILMLVKMVILMVVFV